MRSKCGQCRLNVGDDGELPADVDLALAPIDQNWSHLAEHRPQDVQGCIWPRSAKFGRHLPPFRCWLTPTKIWLHSRSVDQIWAEFGLPSNCSTNTEAHNKMMRSWYLSEPQQFRKCARLWVGQAVGRSPAKKCHRSNLSPGIHGANFDQCSFEFDMSQAPHLGSSGQNEICRNRPRIG